MSKKYELLLKNEPDFRKKVFDVNPELFELKKKYMEELFEKNLGNPNDMGQKLLPKYAENFNRALEGKKQIPYTKEEEEFRNNKVPFSWYLDFTTKMVNDPEYQKLSSGIYVTSMDQKADEADWLRKRKGIFDGYIKACPMSPSGTGPIVNPEDAIYEGQSMVAIKREKQGLPFFGDKHGINPDIAERGHEGEDFVMGNGNPEESKVPFIIEKELGIDVEIYPEEESMYEHLILGDYLQGNMDGICMNLDTLQLEGIEIKTTGSSNFGQQRDYLNGLVPSGYMVQVTCYMAIRGFNFVNLCAGWGLDKRTDWTAIRIKRSLDAEANLLARVLWFSIEIVMKDQEIADAEKYLSPEVLLADLYAIYGEERTGSTIETKDFKVAKASDEYKEILKEEDILKQRNKLALEPISKEKARLEAILLEAAGDNERLIIEKMDGSVDNYFLRTRKTNRFSSKLFDAELKKLKKGEITDEEFNEIVRNRDNFVNESSSRSIKYWSKN